MKKELPDEWQWKKLSDLYTDGKVIFQNGFACGKNNQSGLGLSQLRPMNINSSGKIDLTQVKFVEIAKDTARYSLKKDDVIFNNTNSQELVGKTAVWDKELQDSVLSNHMTIIRFSEDSGILPRYLAKYLHSLWGKKYFEQICTNHVNQSSVGINRLKDIEFPLPPLETQHKIVAILENAEETKKLRRQADELTQKLLQSVFLEMFGDPVINSMNWDTKKLSKLCVKIYGGGTPSKSRPEYYEGNIPWVTPKDMKQDFIGDSIDHITEKAIGESSTKLIPPNSLLMVIRSGILKKKLPVAINTCEVTLNQDMKSFIFDNRLTDTSFMLYFFKIYQRELLNRVRSVTADNLEFDQIKDIDVILPPIELQHRFSQIVEQVERTRSSQRQSFLEINNLLDALMQKAFTGELVL